MASKKKIEKSVNDEEKIVKSEEKVEKIVKSEEETKENQEKIEKNVEQVKKPVEQAKKGPKYPLGSIVFISKEAQADLNGFKLFPPYKKYTYTVEAYDENTGVYSLRRLNLSLKLKECDVVSPDENANSPVTRAQF